MKRHKMKSLGTLAFMGDAMCNESHMEKVTKCKTPYKTLGSRTSTVSFCDVVLLKTYTHYRGFVNMFTSYSIVPCDEESKEKTKAIYQYSITFSSLQSYDLIN